MTYVDCRIDFVHTFFERCACFANRSHQLHEVLANVLVNHQLVERLGPVLHEEGID